MFESTELFVQYTIQAVHADNGLFICLRDTLTSWNTNKDSQTQYFLSGSSTENMYYFFKNLQKHNSSYKHKYIKIQKMHF